MIRVRTDDVLWPGKSKYKGPRAFGRFRGHHNWVVDCSDHFYHTPALLCKELEKYEGAIEYIKRETGEGRMLPILHGWEHLDYGDMPRLELFDHVYKAFQWFDKHLDMEPSFWATPWGADSDEILRAGSVYGMKIETTDPPVIDQKDAHALVEKSGSVACLDGRVVMVHWWELGTRLARICYTGKYGSWSEAKKAKPEYFK